MKKQQIAVKYVSFYLIEHKKSFLFSCLTVFMVKNKTQILCQKIISGGQTGVDRGTLNACLKLNFPCGGWCPKGRLAEDGVIPAIYPLRETAEPSYKSRTLQNVLDADATLILSNSELKRGTKLTAELAKEYSKPLFIFTSENRLDEIRNWLFKKNIKILNVAGPRESEWPGATSFSYQLITKLIKQ